jgi:hypothetical protein
MKQFKTLDDAQKVINELYNTIEALKTKDQDRRGLKLSNNGDGTDPGDYVTLRQITKKQQEPDTEFRYRTFVWSKDGVVTSGEDSPAYIVGSGIDGCIPHQVWVCCEPGHEPSGGDLVINVAWTRYDSGGSPTISNLLDSDLHLPVGTNRRVFSSAFDNTPQLGQGAKVNKVITTGSATGFVSIGLVVKYGVKIR